ncbi:hypothetical protein P9112_013974 [Eukaryota sp. TZLM1-RC]
MMTSDKNDFDNYSPNRQVATLSAWLELLGTPRDEISNLILDGLQNVVISHLDQVASVASLPSPPDGLDDVLTDPVLTNMFQSHSSTIGAIASELAIKKNQPTTFRPDLSVYGQLALVTSMLEECLLDPLGQKCRSKVDQLLTVPDLAFFFCFVLNSLDFSTNSDLNNRRNILLKQFNSDESLFLLESSIYFPKSIELINLVKTVSMVTTSQSPTQADLQDVEQELTRVSPDLHYEVYEYFRKISILDKLLPHFVQLSSKKRASYFINIFHFSLLPGHNLNVKSICEEFIDNNMVKDSVKHLNNLSALISNSPFGAYLVIYRLDFVFHNETSPVEATKIQIFELIIQLSKYKPFHNKILNLLYYFDQPKWKPAARTMHDNLRKLWLKGFHSVLIFLKHTENTLVGSNIARFIASSLNGKEIDEDLRDLLREVSSRTFAAGVFEKLLK